MNWSGIIEFVISVSGVSAIIGYVGKKLVDKVLDAGVEKYKASLDKELELFKADLTRINIEHQIKYDKLSEARADKISQLYSVVYALEEKLKYLTSVWQGPEWSTDTTRQQDVKQLIDDLREILELNRIYFTQKLCDGIEFVIKESVRILNDIFAAKLYRKSDEDLISQGKGHLIENPHKHSELWNRSDEFVNNEFKKARLEIVDEFRELMGVRP